MMAILNKDPMSNITIQKEDKEEAIQLFLKEMSLQINCDGTINASSSSTSNSTLCKEEQQQPQVWKCTFDQVAEQQQQQQQQLQSQNTITAKIQQPKINRQYESIL
jgi:hypothetical protein